MSNNGVDPEVWKPVPDYEGYFASRDGRVLSTKRSNPRVLKTPCNGSGYPVVGLRKNGEARYVYLHQVILWTYVGPAPEGFETRHLDGDPLNNGLDNLSYGTKSENCSDQVRHGTHHMSRRTHCPKGHELPRERNRKTGRDCPTCNASRSRRWRNRVA